jgi:hypothetical protein
MWSLGLGVVVAGTWFNREACFPDFDTLSSNFITDENVLSVCPLPLLPSECVTLM